MKDIEIVVFQDKSWVRITEYQKLVEENDIELYSVLDRVSCWCCRNKNLKELKNIYNFLPNYWEKLRELQKKNRHSISE